MVENPAFRITLTPDKEWILTSDSQVREWTEKFATICGFPSCEEPHFCQSPKIYVQQKEGTISSDLVCRFSDIFLDMFEDPQTGSWVIFVDMARNREQTSWSLQMSWALYPIYDALMRLGGVMVHASCIEKDGTGVLIIAPGGTGKSTCARRVKTPWTALCDDLALLIPDKSGWIARPIPTWSEYLWGEPCNLSWNFERTVPVSLLCYLQQGAADRILPIGSGEAAHLQYRAGTDNLLSIINRGGHTDENRTWWRREIFNSVSRVVQEIPVCRLEATLDGAFWEEIERYLSVHHEDNRS